jgi:serine/threonine protein kinase
MLSCLLDVARGLEYLHNKGLMHGDLKAGNVCLVSSNSAAAGVASPALCNGSADACRHSHGNNTQGFDFVCKVRKCSISDKRVWTEAGEFGSSRVEQS